MISDLTYLPFRAPSEGRALLCLLFGCGLRPKVFLLGPAQLVQWHRMHCRNPELATLSPSEFFPNSVAHSTAAAPQPVMMQSTQHSWLHISISSGWTEGIMLADLTWTVRPPFIHGAFENPSILKSCLRNNITGCANRPRAVITAWLHSLVIALGSVGQPEHDENNRSWFSPAHLEALAWLLRGTEQGCQIAGAWLKPGSCRFHGWTYLAAYTAEGGRRAASRRRLPYNSGHSVQKTSPDLTSKHTLHSSCLQYERSAVAHLCWRVMKMTSNLHGQQ